MRKLGGRVASVVALAVVAAGLSGTAAATQVSGRAAVPLAECWSSDNGLPVVTAVAVDRTLVDVRHGPVDVAVRVRADDTGGPGGASGLRSVVATLGVPAVPKVGGESVTATLAPQPDGWWAGVATVPEVGRFTDWRVFQVLAVDAAGNSVTFDAEQLDVLSPHLTVVRPRNSIAPEVQSLRATRRVDVRRHARYVTFRAHVTDPDEAATAAVTVNGVTLHRVSGTPNDGRWRGRLRVPRGTVAGQHGLTIRMLDADEALRVAWWGPLRSHGQDWRYIVRSHPDTTSPAPRDVRLSPTVDVVDADASISVQLRVVDAQTGTTQVEALVLDSSGSSWIGSQARRVSGSRRDGVWRTTLPLARCTTRAGAHDVYGILTDRVGNEYNRKLGTVMVVAGDHHGPVLGVRGFGVHESPDGPLEVTFDEAATGVSTESLRVMHENDAVAGTWACQDAVGTTVDCVAGPVRRATFVTSAQPVKGTTYSVLINPEHTLDLRDALGNPSRPRSVSAWFVWF